MNTKIVWVFVGLLVVCFLSYSGVGKIVSGQDNKNNDQWKQAKIAYAQAVLAVAQADLAKARAANTRAAETIPSSVVRGLQNDVAVAQARVSVMKGDATPGGENPYMIAAKDALAFAQENLQQAQSVNTKVPGAIGKVELDRRQADVDLAKARYDAASLLNKISPQEAAEWELLQMQEELHDLGFRVGLLQFRN
ncbi:MAG TPA: hypothetical protein VFE46_13885 [Pirellulales bacterium]|jgi:hypothetical protein|nr:hypothetical protein [Pirellulales bacterium]